MERFPVELLYILGFIAIVLFNFFGRRAARLRQQQQEAQSPAPPPAEDELAEDVWGRTRTPPPSAPMLVARAAPPPVRAELSTLRRVHPVRALLKDRNDLRRAVVLVMVLGPCSAQQPPER